LSILNRTAAEIAAAALCEIFPDIELLGGGDTSVGFSYDFYFPHPISPKMEVVVAEKMRQIARERRSIRTLEMVPVSAKEFLIQKGRAARLEEVEATDGLVEIIEMGDFVDLSSGPHLKNSNELSAFKLWPIEVLGNREYRVNGCAFQRKDELNCFLKKLQAYRETSHMAIGERKSLWKIWRGEVLWLQSGIKEKKEFIEFLKKNLFEECLEINSFGNHDRIELYADLSQKIPTKPLYLSEVYQASALLWDKDSGLFSGDGGEKIQISFYDSSLCLDESLISSLQSVAKTLNILGFEYTLLLTCRGRSEKASREILKVLERFGKEFEVQEDAGLRIDLLIEDNLGRRWVGFSWYLVQKGFYMLGFIERLYAFLLEKSI